MSPKIVRLVGPENACLIHITLIENPSNQLMDLPQERGMLNKVSVFGTFAPAELTLIVGSAAKRGPSRRSLRKHRVELQ